MSILRRFSQQRLLPVVLFALAVGCSTDAPGASAPVPQAQQRNQPVADESVADPVVADLTEVVEHPRASLEAPAANTAAVNTIDVFIEKWEATLINAPGWELSVGERSGVANHLEAQFLTVQNGAFMGVLVFDDGSIASVMLFVPALIGEGSGLRALSVAAAAMHPTLGEIDVMVELTTMAPPAAELYASLELAGFKVCRVASEAVATHDAVTVFVLQPPALASECREGILTGQ